ncbi:hypothetical protein ABW20_dc0104296 [Dactylellina cionopaga]|nr:hypothetical protein ABW20_dc0104296 [Dactylellina cionopaga]
MAAAEAMLDEFHEDLERHPNDHNTYALGKIGNHNIVIACLPLGVYGTTSAATVASRMLSTFTSIRFCLMVGIGGGVPSAKADIRLGDVVVSTRVVQYDYGKTVREGRFERMGSLNKPPDLLLNAIAHLEAKHKRIKSQTPEILSEMLDKYPLMRAKYSYCGQEQDVLFETNYDHPEFQDTCEGCNKDRLVARSRRVETNPVVHRGTIASGNQVMKHGSTRDRLGQELDILCFEMEAAGLMDSFPVLVVRGVADYSDSHKNKQWQEYSSATAAAYTKELLLMIPATESAHTETCIWLLEKSEYRDWLDPHRISDHHGLLWIKGKPGTGKSTIMKFALKNAEETMTQKTLVISFFFNARGRDLEKSTIGMYRSLLFQLLKKVPDSQTIFDSLGLPPTLDISSHLQWNVELLKDIFRRAIEKLGQRGLICFIDALDECEEDQVRDMVAFFEILGQLAASAQIRLNVCFSSRHYPHITIDKGQHLTLEGQEGHDNDIAAYLSSELKAGRSPQVEEIKTEILGRASGIFLWVVLVVQILNKEYDRGRMHALHKKLQEIPTKLGELFTNILTRDGQNIEDSLLCIQWILYANRPLNVGELYFAILSDEDPEALGRWNREVITIEDMERFILNSSKGLAEMTKSGKSLYSYKQSEFPIVQFIHESVRDFLLKENGLSNLWSGFEGSSLKSHERLKQGCHTYINMAFSQYPGNPAPSKINPRMSLAFVGDPGLMFPFLRYAIGGILYHADVAGGAGFSQETFLENFSLKKWLTLNNFVQYGQSAYSIYASLLYILADQNLPSLIEAELRRVPHMDIEGEHHGFPIFAALDRRNKDAVRALLVPKMDLEFESDGNQDLSNQYHSTLNKLLQSGHNIERHKGQTLLNYAVHRGEWDLTRLLLATKKVDTNSRRKDGRSPLSLAAENGQEAVVKLLLENGADSESRDGFGNTPLQYAKAKRHTAVVKLLLERDIEFADKNGTTPLPYNEIVSKLDTANKGGRVAVKLRSENNAKSGNRKAKSLKHKKTCLLL